MVAEVEMPHQLFQILSSVDFQKVSRALVFLVVRNRYDQKVASRITNSDIHSNKTKNENKFELSQDCR